MQSTLVTTLSVTGLHVVIPAVCFALRYILYMEGNWSAI